MSRYVVAVSGGVDSVVLLDMLSKYTDHELIVAHVDHGIRPDSHEDRSFVRQLAESYGLPFYPMRLSLGANASEEAARDARYAFLRALAEERGARVVTAHHADDVVETVAINLHRGTGWRGLATHDADIVRPLLGYRKDQLKAYAQSQGLVWREDSTNQDDRYLRNRIRRHVTVMPVANKKEILQLRKQQLMLKKLIQTEVTRLVGEGPVYSRYFFTHIPKVVALECLRAIMAGKLTRPQLERGLLAIKTATTGSTYEAGAGTRLQFTTRNFSVALIK